MSGSITLDIEGQSIEVAPGTTLAAALLAAGYRTLGTRPRAGTPRGMFCGMGVCHECAVTVDGTPGVRACIVEVRDGMRLSLHP